MKRLPYLYYKGINSLDLSLTIKSKGSYNTAERDKEFISVPGRNGDLIQDNGRYKNVQIPYDLSLIKRDSRPFNDLVNDIKKWLALDSGYYELWDSYDPRYFRYAAVENAVNVISELTDYGELAITFNCKPFRFTFDGLDPINISSAGGKLLNPEIMPSKPYIKIYGSGDISLHVNAITITISGVVDYVEIDSDTMNVYKGITLLNSSATGDTFPTLEPGENNVTFTGNVTGAEIVPRWCTL